MAASGFNGAMAEKSLVNDAPRLGAVVAVVVVEPCGGQRRVVAALASWSTSCCRRQRRRDKARDTVVEQALAFESF